MPRFKLGTLTLALALSSPLHAFAAPLLDTATAPAASQDLLRQIHGLLMPAQLAPQ